MSSRQQRSISARPTLTKRDAGLPMISGYAAVYYDSADPGTEYRLWEDLVERIRPGAFDRAVREDDVRALFNHDSSLILGRSTSKTLRLSLDSRGLRYEIDPPDTQVGRDLVANLERGDVSGSSFAFMPTKTTWQELRDSTGKTTYVRWIDEVELFDVGPVTYPAYSSTEAGLRSAERDEELRRELDIWVNRRESFNPTERLALLELLAIE
jgi:uncharacterized protein